jgi:hypothetical protein
MAPSGWACECDGSQGVDGIFRPEAEEPEAAIYAAVAPREADQTFDAFVRGELERLKGEAGGEVATTQEPSLATVDKRTIEVRAFTRHDGGRVGVAFVRERKVRELRARRGHALDAAFLAPLFQMLSQKITPRFVALNHME